MIHSVKLSRKLLLQMENVHEKRVYIIMSDDVNVEGILLLLHPHSKDVKGEPLLSAK